MNIELNWNVKSHNAQTWYGEWMTREDIPASHADEIDSAILEGDVADGDVITCEGGDMYLVSL